MICEREERFKKVVIQKEYFEKTNVPKVNNIKMGLNMKIANKMQRHHKIVSIFQTCVTVRSEIVGICRSVSSQSNCVPNIKTCWEILRDKNELKEGNNGVNTMVKRESLNRATTLSFQKLSVMRIQKSQLIILRILVTYRCIQIYE